MQATGSGGCGAQEQDEDPTPAPLAAPTFCVRCKAPATIAVRVTAWCNDCFHRAFASRFHKAIECARIVSAEGIDVLEGRKPERRRKDPSPPKPPGKLVLAFSGGASSRALLELVKTSYFSHLLPLPPANAAEIEPPATAEDDATAVEGATKKKKGSRKHGLVQVPKFAECEVVFVDESSAPGYGEDRTEEIRRLVESTTPFFSLTVLKLEDVFDPSSSSSTSAPLNTSFASPSLPSTPSSTSSASPRDQLLSLLSPSLVSPSSRDSLHSSLLSTLLRSHARRSGAETLLLGDSATRVAIRTLANMSSGRGFSAGEEVAAHYVDRAGGDAAPLLVVRPFSLALAKEIVYFSRATREGGLESLMMRNPETSVGGEGEKAAPVDVKKRGLGALCEDFILSLEADFPSTVSTVVRTAHKLGLRSADAVSRSFAGEWDKSEAAGCNCVVCGLPAQPDAHAWRAAITISDLVTAKALLAASPSSSAPPLSSALRQALPVNPTPSSATNPLEPYQPSPAHLLLSADVEAPAALVEALAPPPPPRATAAPSLSDEVDGTTSLAKYLCYACLLVLQEPTTTALKPRPGAAKTVDLPPYVSEAVRARQTLEEQEREVVEMKTVKGEEALRREVGEFLLEE